MGEYFRVTFSFCIEHYANPSGGGFRLDENVGGDSQMEKRFGLTVSNLKRVKPSRWTRFWKFFPLVNFFQRNFQHEAGEKIHPNQEFQIHNCVGKRKGIDFLIKVSFA